MDKFTPEVFAKMTQAEQYEGTVFVTVPGGQALLVQARLVGPRSKPKGINRRGAMSAVWLAV
jgi:hypothetical protein